MALSGYEFSVAQQLLVLAKGEGNRGIRAWCGQKHAEHSVAHPSTRYRGSQDFLVRVLMLHDPCMEQLSPSTSRSELDLQTSQPVNEEMQAWHITGSSDQGGGLGSCWSLACVWLLPPS